VLLSLGLNIVVGFAGLLDLGYIAFYAVGHTLRTARFAAFQSAPAVLGHPARCGCRLFFRRAARRTDVEAAGDHLAIVTLGFGEIVRIFLNNCRSPSISPTVRRNQPIDPFRIGNFSFSKNEVLAQFHRPEVLLPAAPAAGDHRRQPALAKL
jgi:branched-chain amino acid transport system permease protein